MPMFASAKELFDRVTELERAYGGSHSALAVKVARDASYYEGLQWCISSGGTLVRHPERVNADSGKVRITANRITRNVERVASQTFPSTLNVTAKLPDRDRGPDAAHRTDVFEDAVHCMARGARFMAARQVANDRRAIVGDYGVGLTIEQGQRAGRDDSYMRCFHFAPTSLWLDPAVDEVDLRCHREVAFRDVWDASRIERVFGVKLDRDNLKSVGQLTTGERELSRISDGRLFPQFRSDSKTKGAVVWQWHMRGHGGRFDEMYVVIEADPPDSRREDTSKGMIWVNEDDPVSPFGGDGLPLAMYRGRSRYMGPWSISDTALLINDQDRVNLAATLETRWLLRSAGFQIVADLATLKDKGAKESFQNAMTNQLGGAAFIDTKNRRGAQQPYIMNYPTPPPFLPEMARNAGREMEQQLALSDPSLGRTKSHVADRTVGRVLEEIGEVKSMRIRNDLDQDAKFLTMMLGTGISLAKEGSPTILGELRSEGFEPRDLRVLLNADPENMGVTLKVHESSVRNRPPEVKREELFNSVTAGLVNPIDARLSLVTDLEAPLMEHDGFMAAEAVKATQEILGGEEWEPIPLGGYTQFFIQAFTIALRSRQARRDPDARQRLSAAIQLQQEMAVQQALASDPALAAQGRPPEGAPPEQAPPPAMTIGEVLALAGQTAA